MSRIQQKNFLVRLRKELDGSSEAFRELTANKLKHEFSITTNALEKALVEATFRLAQDMKGQVLSVSDVKVWVSMTFAKSFSTFISEVYNNIKKYKSKQVKVENLKADIGSLSATFKVIEKSGIDVFGAIKDRYDTPLTKLYEEFEVKVKAYLRVTGLKYTTIDKKKRQPVDKELTRGFVFQLEHQNIGQNTTSNIDLFIAQKFNKTARGTLKKDQVEKIILGIDKNLNLDKPSVARVFLGSGIANRREASSEGARRTDLIKKIDAAIKQLSEKNAVLIAEQAGSDSLIETKRKAALKQIDKAFSTRKRVKSSFKEPSKLNKKGTEKPVTLDVSPKVTEVKTKRYKTPKAKKVSLRHSRQTFNSLNFLLGILNQQLPQAVAENMGSPRLNYQTGRFASSVRVTDIATTAKGFPSIGYTYMKYPYQTFEPGYRQGNVDRDPRKLIDKSIRDIAADFAIGRFYTRRV